MSKSQIYEFKRNIQSVFIIIIHCMCIYCKSIRLCLINEWTRYSIALIRRHGMNRGLCALTRNFIEYSPQSSFVTIIVENPIVENVAFMHKLHYELSPSQGRYIATANLLQSPPMIPLSLLFFLGYFKRCQAKITFLLYNIRNIFS